MKRFVTVFLSILAVSLISPHPAAAYLDPGSGSFLFQFLIAGLLGAGVALKVFWGRIKQVFTGKNDNDISGAGENE